MINYQDILQIENNADLLSVREPATGIPAWMLIRNQYFREVLSDLVFEKSIRKASYKKLRIQDLINISFRTLYSNLKFRRKRKYQNCVISSGSGVIKGENNAYDRIGGYFADSHENDCLYINELKNFKFPENLIHKNIYFNFVSYRFLLLKKNLSSYRKAKKLARYVLRKAAKASYELINWVPSDKRFQILQNSLTKSIQRAPYLVSHYEELIKSFGIKLLLVEGGMYSGYIPTIVGAKNAGAITAEYQHGSVFPGHDAYNFADIILESETCRKIFPDYFLSYGEWWHEQFNAPVKKVAIGNPHLTEFSNTILKTQQIKKNEILILSDGINTEKYIKLAQDIKLSLSNSNLIVKLRLHPMEVKLKSTIDQSITIDKEANFYKSASCAKLVIGEVSTGLFEALKFAEHVIIWSSKRSRFGFPSFPLPSFEKVSEVIHFLNSPKSSTHNYPNLNMLWQENWKETYKNFLNSVII